jgi:tetratricopeptide (TPR) repeat protein
VLRASGGEGVPLLTAAQARCPQDFWLNFELGEALHQDKRWDEALGYYRAALALRPESCAVHNHLGEALRAQGRLDEAIGHFQQAIRLNPKSSAAAHTNLGAALRAQGRLDEAIGHYQQAVCLDPKLAVAHTHLGVALKDKGRLDEAIGHFQQAVRLDPNLAVAHTHLGNCLYAATRAAARDAADQGPKGARLGAPERAGLRRQALDRLRAALALRTKLLQGGQPVYGSLTAWQTDPALAGVRDRAALGQLPDAERQEWQCLWADVAALRAADPREQGRAHAARRDWAQAADSYARALRRGPTADGHLWFEYAAVLLLSGDRPGYAKACAHLVERCGQAPNLRAYQVARACTLAPDAGAEAARAGRLAQQELQANAREYWSLTEQGALHYRAGRFQEAVPLFERSLRADPKPGRAVLNWLWLALAHHRLGRAEDARRWLGQAQAWLDQYGDGMPSGAETELGLDLRNWLEAHVLRREAEALLGTRPAGPKSPDPAAIQKKGQ